MKRYVYLLLCMAISFTLLSGCESYTNNNSAKENQDTVIIINSDKTVETRDWEPTIHETLNNFDGVTMIVQEGTISSTGLTVILENNSDKQCIYGEDFLVEKHIKGKWYQIPVVVEGNYGFNTIGYDLTPSEVKEWVVDWEWIYGKLDIGEYRIIKDILDFRKTGDYDKYYLATEFTID